MRTSSSTYWHTTLDGTYTGPWPHCYEWTRNCPPTSRCGIRLSMCRRPCMSRVVFCSLPEMVLVLSAVVESCRLNPVANPPSHSPYPARTFLADIADRSR